MAESLFSERRGPGHEGWDDSGWTLAETHALVQLVPGSGQHFIGETHHSKNLSASPFENCSG